MEDENINSILFKIRLHFNKYKSELLRIQELEKVTIIDLKNLEKIKDNFLLDEQTFDLLCELDIAIEQFFDDEKKTL